MLDLGTGCAYHFLSWHFANKTGARVVEHSNPLNTT